LRRFFAAVLAVALNLSPIAYSQQPAGKSTFHPPTSISGYRDASAELQAEKAFLAVPSAALAKEHLRTLSPTRQTAAMTCRESSRIAPTIALPS